MAAEVAAGRLSLAVVGAGPIGLELAVAAAARGVEVEVFESSPSCAGAVESWQHVTLFSPWSMNSTEAGRGVVVAGGRPSLDLAAVPTGRQLVDEYLAPLAAGLLQMPSCRGIRYGTKVVSVGRGSLLKGESIGGGSMKMPVGKPLCPSERRATPFRLLLAESAGPEGDVRERYAEGFDLVADCSGSYHRVELSNWAGKGGVPALGERQLRASGKIWSLIPNVLGADRARFAGRRALVLGAGYCAATTVRDLLRLPAEECSAGIIWMTRSAGNPYQVLPDDPLPQRAELCHLGNRAAAGELPGVTSIGGAGLRAVECLPGGRIRVVFEVSVDEEVVERCEEVDEVVCCVGYRPETSLFGELQVHQCYASDGPMKLAATLLGGSGDCLAQASAGFDSLKNPEPGFFILGSKSYGRSSAFLLKIGHEQIREVVDGLVPAALASAAPAAG